jgi:hypothetical protein
MSGLGLRTLVRVGCLLAVGKKGSDWALCVAGAVPPPAFCKRVRKRLILG